MNRSVSYYRIYASAPTERSMYVCRIDEGGIEFALAKLRMATPTWEFFAWRPLQDKHAIDRKFSHEQTTKAKTKDRSGTCGPEDQHGDYQNRHFGSEAPPWKRAEQAQPEVSPKVPEQAADQSHSRRRGDEQEKTGGHRPWQ